MRRGRPLQVSRNHPVFASKHPERIADNVAEIRTGHFSDTCLKRYRCSTTPYQLPRLCGINNKIKENHVDVKSGSLYSDRPSQSGGEGQTLLEAIKMRR